MATRLRFTPIGGLLVLLAGCGGATAVTRAPTTPGGGEVELAELLRENDALRDRVDDLEGRLASLEARNAELERTLDARTEREEIDTADLDVDTSAPEGETDEGGARPLLRLSGPPPGPEARPALAATSPLAGPPAPLVVAPPPTGSLGRLIVTGAPGDVPAIPATPVTVGAPTPEVDGATREYQEALRLLSTRDVDAALRALATFVTRHPDHAYADNALYFRGEILYAQRAYREAIRELELLVARYPSGSRVADALLRIGTCWERLGDSTRAATFFLRVRTEHPDSTAARMAEREDT